MGLFSTFSLLLGKLGILELKATSAETAKCLATAQSQVEDNSYEHSGTEIVSHRIKNAERDARHDQAMTKAALLTIMADSNAPRDPHAKAAHYKHHLGEAHRVIEVLQLRLTEVEAERDKIRKDGEYWLTLCVPRSTADKALLSGFRLGIGKATNLAEPDGGPNMLSDAISKIREPKARWSK